MSFIYDPSGARIFVSFSSTLYWFHFVLNTKLRNNIRNRILLNAKGLILTANGLNSSMLSTTFHFESCLQFSTKNGKKLIWTVYFSSFFDLAITLES